MLLSNQSGYSLGYLHRRFGGGGGGIKDKKREKKVKEKTSTLFFPLSYPFTLSLHHLSGFGIASLCIFRIDLKEGFFRAIPDLFFQDDKLGHHLPRHCTKALQSCRLFIQWVHHWLSHAVDKHGSLHSSADHAVPPTDE